MNAVVRVRELSKLYKVYPDSWSRVLEWLSLGRLQRHQEKWALKDITFEVPKGSALGVVGANGAGKSTLLKILTGITPPSEGGYEIEGRIGSLLELGAGFHPEFTGRDNVFMNAAIMGIPKAEVKTRFEELAEFAELGEYLQRPVRTYSSGMIMRLGFAVAMMAMPEVMILDEILAVGDQRFQKKCMDKIHEIRMRGTTILFVSHSIYHVRQICDHAIWLQNGHLVKGGDPITITDEYQNAQLALAAGRDPFAEYAARSDGHLPSALPHLEDAVLRPVGSSNGKDTYTCGDQAELEVTWANPGDEAVHLGLIVLRNDDLMVFGVRSVEAGLVLDQRRGRLRVRLPLDLLAGEYYLAGYLLDRTADHVLDQRLSWVTFRVEHSGMETGIYLPSVEWDQPEERP